jgi:hypothetical protein
MKNAAIRILVVDDDEDDYVILRDMPSEIRHGKWILSGFHPMNRLLSRRDPASMISA